MFKFKNISASLHAICSALRLILCCPSPKNKNILQVKIQKEFKVTPHYLQIINDPEDGYKMGVYLCLGQPIYSVNIKDAININSLNSFKGVQDYINFYYFMY